MAKLFVEPLPIYRWKDIKSFLVRSQHNELLHVVQKEFEMQYKNQELPRFLDPSRCLTLVRPKEGCQCAVRIGAGNASASTTPDPLEGLRQAVLSAENRFKNAEAQRNIAAQQLAFEWKNFEAKKQTLTIEPAQEAELVKLAKAMEEKKDIKVAYDSVLAAAQSAAPLKTALIVLGNPIEAFEKSVSEALIASVAFQGAKAGFDRSLREAQLNVGIATEQLQIALSNYQVDPSTDNEKKKRDAEIDLNDKKRLLAQTQNRYQLPATEDCLDAETDYFCPPHFLYQRKLEILSAKTQGLDFSFQTSGLTIGAVYWLYQYECMGIFKIAGELLDDFNFKGKYTISGSRTNGNGEAIRYSVLMDLISTLYSTGMGSTTRARTCTYQRTLGVSVKDNPGVESEYNTGLKKTFEETQPMLLSYFADKRLREAIQNGGTPRSSVATQTSILDSITLLKQQMEPFQYGSNQRNTFLGLTMVYATLALLYLVRKEIGIPDQYERPEEFVPAAYDILVAKKPAMISEKNRFMLYDNAASYGYRLLTDFETLDIKQLTVSSVDSTLTAWLDDRESTVEGLKNALDSLPERADLIAANS